MSERRQLLRRSKTPKQGEKIFKSRVREQAKKVRGGNGKNEILKLKFWRYCHIGNGKVLKI